MALGVQILVLTCDDDVCFSLCCMCIISYQFSKLQEKLSRLKFALTKGRLLAITDASLISKYSQFSISQS